MWSVLLAEAHTRLDRLESLVQKQQPQQQQQPAGADTSTGARKRSKPGSKTGVPASAKTGTTAAEAGEEEGGAFALVAAARSAARGVALVAQAVHHFRCVVCVVLHVSMCVFSGKNSTPGCTQGGVGACFPRSCTSWTHTHTIRTHTLVACMHHICNLQGFSRGELR